MSIQFKYKDINVRMSEDDGKFSIEGSYRSYDWMEIKRKIDNAHRAKYKPFKAVYYGGVLNGSTSKIVTVTRPQIGSDDMVWTTDENNKREVHSLKYLYPIEYVEKITELTNRIGELRKEQRIIENEITSIENVKIPEQEGSD